MNLAAVRGDLKNRLETISDLNCYGFVPATPIVPAAVIHLEPTKAHAAMDDTSIEIHFGVQILVQMGEWETMQDQLDSFTSTGTETSVIDAIEKTVGDYVFTVESLDGYNHVSIGNGEVVYASVLFHVLTEL